MMALARGPRAIASVAAPWGERFILAVEPIPTDTVHTLYRSSGRLDPWWQDVASLDYWEDGRFTGSEAIILSADARWLLVARAGIWTDCLHMAGHDPAPCHLSVSPDWSRATYETDMRARSAAIGKMMGLAPPMPK